MTKVYPVHKRTQSWSFYNLWNKGHCQEIMAAMRWSYSVYYQAKKNNWKQNEEKYRNNFHPSRSKRKKLTFIITNQQKFPMREILSPKFPYQIFTLQPWQAFSLWRKTFWYLQVEAFPFLPISCDDCLIFAKARFGSSLNLGKSTEECPKFCIL